MAVEPGRRGRCTMLLAAALLLAGCASGGSSPLPPTPPVVDVQMREFAFDHGRIPSGRVVFAVHNTGTIAHRLSLVPLPDDLPPIVDQLRGDQRQSVFTLAAVPDVPPGGTGTFAVDLKPGRYALICFIVDPDGISHGVKGMATDVRVT